MLETFINWTAWKMETPKAYGPFHLIWAVVGISLCILLAWRLRKLQARGNRILLTGIGTFLAICEIYKQLFYFYYIGDGSYQWWIFPFQMCSVPMYLCIIAPFLKPGRIQSGMYHFMMIYNLMGGIMSLIEPSGLLHSYWTLTLHAFIWHTILIFVGLYLGFSSQTTARWADFRLSTWTLLALCLTAFCINLVFWDVSGGDINMFFVGPQKSSLAVFSTIAEACGWYVGTLIYIPAMCLGGLVVFLPFHFHKNRNIRNTQSPAGVFK